MALDEEGQADTVEQGHLRPRYDLLTGDGWAPGTSSDPNVLAVAMIEEQRFARRSSVGAADRERCPGSRTSGGISTSRSRSAATTSCGRRCTRVPRTRSRPGRHGIVNAGQPWLQDIADLLEHRGGRPHDRRPDATDRLVSFAATGTRRRSWISWREARSASGSRCAARHSRLHREDTERRRRRRGRST
jgi:5-methyltetrahydrofolate--homocysteine methyltransferase